MRAISAALRKALAQPANGVRLRLWRYCHRLRKPHYVFTTREAADFALFTWGMAMRDRGSRTHNLLTVFGCGDHWHVGRQRREAPSFTKRLDPPRTRA